MKLRSEMWWALVTEVRNPPMLFETRWQAAADQEPDEHLIRVIVQAAHPKQRQAKPKSDARRKNNRDWYHRRRARGLCGKCGKPNDREPKWTCAQCARTMPYRQRKERAT